MAIQSYLLIGAGVVGALGLLTLTLPSSVHIEREAIIKASPDKVYELTSSNQGFQSFNPYKDDDPELKIVLFGPDRGIGSGFNFSGKDGQGSQTISSLEHNKSVTMQINLGVKGKPIQTFNFEAAPEGTKVIWGLDADFDYNPIGRVIGLFMDKMMGETLERGLRNLSVAADK